MPEKNAPTGNVADRDYTENHYDSFFNQNNTGT